MSFMSTMSDPQILTKRKRGNPIVETKPKCEQWCYMGNRIMGGYFIFFAYSFNFQICYNASLHKKKDDRCYFLK